MARFLEEPCTLTARWVFPVDGPPLPGGTVTVQGDRITAVDPAGRRRADLDLGNAAVLPGLVNCHTHLDLSGLRGRCPPSPNFIAWLRTVIRHRRAATAAQVEGDIRAGLAESLGHGVTLLADISAQGGSWTVLSAAPVRALVLYELLGLPEARASQSLAEARDWLAVHPATDHCRPGLSPHAPYSVRASLFREVAGLRPPCPVAIHLAETREELDLLTRHTGPFVPFLTELGVWDPKGLIDDADTLLRLPWPKAPLLLAHGNYLDPAAPFPPSATVVYCPRTHAAFGHSPHPFRELLRRGVHVALGTDSLASNPDLSVLAEARFLHQTVPEVPGSLLLHLATLAGALALGWADQAGSLTPGKSADLVVVQLPQAEAADPHDLVLSGKAAVTKVLWRGSWLTGPTAITS
jgi:cytosine/adenosine deaminase-related metal-dependent hydrolase